MMIGVDEAGRGCLAGPVVVGAVALPSKFRMPKGLPELRDSKKMTRLQREEWYGWLTEIGPEKGIIFSVHAVSPSKLDKINIAAAGNLAAWRGVKRLAASIEDRMRVTLDGGLFLKSRLFQERGVFGKGIDLDVRTVVKADMAFTEVMLAATLAKVTRDRRMEKIGKRYPEYGFEVHKGYGTKRHIEALLTHGPIEGLHRNTFISGIIEAPSGVESITYSDGRQNR